MQSETTFVEACIKRRRPGAVLNPASPLISSSVELPVTCTDRASNDCGLVPVSVSMFESIMTERRVLSRLADKRDARAEFALAKEAR